MNEKRGQNGATLVTVSFAFFSLYWGGMTRLVLFTCSSSYSQAIFVCPKVESGLRVLFFTFRAGGVLLMHFF